MCDGSYTRFLSGSGLRCYGYDGNPDTYNATGGLCNVLDFSQPVYLDPLDVVLFGKIGTVAEEEAAEVVKEGKFSKPLVAYIAGRSLPAGMRFSHASAIIERGRGTAESKVQALEAVGAHIVEHPQEIAVMLKSILRGGETK